MVFSKIKQFIYLVGVLMFSTLKYSAQSFPVDTVLDNYGKKHSFADINLDKKIDMGGGATIAAYPTTCTAGYFDIYYEVGCGMEGNTPVEQARRNVVCQVYTDLSNWINSPLSFNTNPLTNKVKIAIRPYSSFSVTGAIGVGTHLLLPPPTTGSSLTNFVLDHAVWKTIITGTDAAAMQAYPAQIPPNTYHGAMGFDFNGLNGSGCSFNYTLANAPSSTEYDFYQLVLHEAGHVLGLMSYINYNGFSTAIPMTKFFSRYDLFLKSGINNLPLVTDNPNCVTSWLNFNPNVPLSHLSPGSATCGTLPSSSTQNITNCSTSVKFAGASYTTPVYTPDCYNISSLSHFDDNCVSPFTTNAFFVMSKATTCGATSFKRYFKPNEASHLCDIGYSLKTAFGSTVNLNDYTYSFGCASPLAGINDGVINGGFYNIITNVGVSSSPIFPLANDIGATTYTCLQIVTGAGSLSNTSGNGSFIFTPTVAGLHILCYYPLNSAGKKGNLTFVYIFVRDNCPMNCTISSNGGFENATNCGPSFGTSIPLNNSFTLPCWFLNQGSTDLFTRGCTNGLYSLPLTLGGVTLDTPTGAGTGNDRLVGMLAGEGIQNQLSAPLIPGNVYQMSFKYRLSGSSSTSSLLVLGTNLPSGSAVAISNTSIPSSYFQFAVVQTTVPNIWQTFSTTFTYNAANNCNYVSFAADPGNNRMYYLDDFVLVSVGTNTSAASFTLPANLCAGQSVTNLSLNISPNNAMTNAGSFFGPGVALNNGVWSINTAGVPTGVNVYSFVYTNTITNCTFTTYATVTIQPVPTLTISGLNSASVCLTPGISSTTLIAQGTPTPLTYSWMPGGSNASTVILSPTLTTTYTLTGNTGFCTSTKTITVNVIPVISISGSLTHTLCTSTQTLNLTGAITPQTHTAGVWTTITPPGPPPNIGIWTQTVQSGQVYAYAQYSTVPGTHTLNYVFTAIPGCSVAAQYTVQVRNSPTVTGNGPLSACSNIPGYTISLQASSSSTLPMSYTWAPGPMYGASIMLSPTGTMVYTVTGSDGFCLSPPALVEVNTNSACCGGTTNAAPWNYISSGSIGNATLSGLYAINQDLTITGNVKLNGEFYMAPNVTIKVLYGASLNSSYTFQVGPDPQSAKAHLLSCGAMWNGIIVDTYGEVKFEQGDLIEDAKIAISSNNDQNNFTSTLQYDINLEKVVFNRNRIAVSITNYTQVVGFGVPFIINSNVFTCRNFTYVPMTANLNPQWPSWQNLTVASPTINPMASPYLLNSFSPANLKAPYSTEPANAGVYVANSGRTSNPTLSNTTYTCINVGDGNTANPILGIFDNLNAGISAVNSNVGSFGNVFQNTRSIPITPTTPYYEGNGVRASNNNLYGLMYSNNYVNLTAAQSPSTNFNRFYNCETAIHLQNIFQFNLNYSEFRSTQTKTIALGGQLPYMGVVIEGNRFKNYIVNNNKFMNLFYGVVLSTYHGPYNLVGLAYQGQVWGTINIRNNYFSAASSPTSAVNSEFMYYGIISNNLLNSKYPQPLGTGFYTITPYNGLWISDNNFDRVYRGVSLGSFNNGAFGKFVANNTITIVPDHIAGNFQFGVASLNNYNAVINSNNITGFTTTPTTTMSGIYFSMNTSSAAKCNSVVTLPRGFEFAALNSGMIWRYNTMNSDARGMQLSNNGIIGNQGSVNAPNDNFWQGTWTGTNYNTWTDLNSSASASKLYKRTLSGYDPLNNLGIAQLNSYWNSANLVNANNTAPYPSCTPAVPVKGPGGGKPPLAQAIALGNMSYYGPNAAEAEEINRFLLFDDLQGDTSLRNSDPILQSFYNLYLTYEIGQLNQIEETMAIGDLIGASSLVSSFVPTTPIQNNYLLYYSLCLKHMDSTQVLSSQDSSDIGALAQKCPFIDGPIIYNARALDLLVNKSINIYNDGGCDGGGENLFYGGEEYGRMIKPKDEVNLKQFQLFPNPAEDRITIIGIAESNELDILIKDVSDKVLCTKSLRLINNRTELDLNLINGIYFVTLITKNNGITVKKLVISK